MALQITYLWAFVVTLGAAEGFITCVGSFLLLQNSWCWAFEVTIWEQMNGFSQVWICSCIFIHFFFRISCHIEDSWMFQLCRFSPFTIRIWSLCYCWITSSTYRADRPADQTGWSLCLSFFLQTGPTVQLIRRAEASVFPSFFSQLKSWLFFLFEFSLPET